jgi:hypothetical protein
MRYATGARGLGRTPTLEVARTSYKSGCGSISWSLGGTIMPLRFAVTYLFSLYIFFVDCALLTIWNIIFSHGHLRTPNPNPYWVIAGRGSRMSRGTITCRYMTYSNVFDCITSTQIRQHLSTCHLYLHVAYLVVLTSAKNFQVTWQSYEIDGVQEMGLNAI